MQLNETIELEKNHLGIGAKKTCHSFEMAVKTK